MGILGPRYCGIGATIRIGREMLCLPYAGFFVEQSLVTPGLEMLFEIQQEKYVLFSKLFIVVIWILPTIQFKVSLEQMPSFRFLNETLTSRLKENKICCGSM